MYEYIFTGLVGCIGGFVCGGCFFSDSSRVQSMDRDMDELEQQLNVSRQYNRYLENILNDSTGVTTESRLINVIDASANVTQVASVDRMIDTPPVSPIISRNRNRRGVINQPTVPPPSPVARISQSISSRPTAPELPSAIAIEN